MEEGFIIRKYWMIALVSYCSFIQLDMDVLCFPLLNASIPEGLDTGLGGRNGSFVTRVFCHTQKCHIAHASSMVATSPTYLPMIIIAALHFLTPLDGREKGYHHCTPNT